MDIGLSDPFIQVRKMTNREGKQGGLRHQVVDQVSILCVVSELGHPDHDPWVGSSGHVHSVISGTCDTKEEVENNQSKLWNE